MDLEKGCTVALGDELSTLAFWGRPATERAETFARLREEAPVSFHPPPEFGTVPSQQGYWAVTRFDDVVAASRQAEVFCSGQGVTFEDVPVDLLEMASSFLVMDDPRHAELRRVVSRAFTPRRVSELEAAIDDEATRIVDRFVAAGGGDVVSDLAMHLPLWTVSTMMGIPPSFWPDLAAAAQQLVASQDFDPGTEARDPLTAQLEAAMTITEVAATLAAERRRTPGDDLLSALVTSEADGGGLSDQMIASIVLLFVVAGNDTTRNATSHGVRLFAEHPEQWQALRQDRAGLNPAVEEIVRCASPVIQFRRTVTAPTELGGVDLAPGDHVVLFYESANRDAASFVDPDRFDAARDPNHHLGFGGGGPHFCLGANLARAQLRTIFRHLADRCATFDAGPPTYLTSNFVNGVKAMDVTIS